MRPINPIGGATHIVANDQPEYQPLPVRQFKTLHNGVAVTAVASEWEITGEELALLVSGGRIRLTMLTFDGPLSPVMLTVVP